MSLTILGVIRLESLLSMKEGLWRIVRMPGFELMFALIIGFLILGRVLPEHGQNPDGDPMDPLPAPDRTLQAGTDSDSDGLPDAWELDHGHDPGNPADRESDFDRDGLKAWQEYQLWQSTSGAAGNPMGSWEVSVPDLPDDELSGISYSFPLRVSSGGVSLVRIRGSLPSSSPAYHYYIRHPDGEWTRITPPQDYPGTIYNFHVSDINFWGEAVGYVGGSVGYLGFIWESNLWGEGGSSKLYTVDGMNAKPIRISDSGFITGQFYSPGNGRFAAHWDDELDPSGGIGGLNYNDVNLYGEFTGTWYNPMSGRMEAFLASEHLSQPFTTSLGFSDLDRPEFVNITMPDLDWSTVQYTEPDENGNRFGWGEEVGTGYLILFAENEWGDIFWEFWDPSRYGSGYPPGGYASEFWLSVSFSALNSWGELAGSCSAYQSFWGGNAEDEWVDFFSAFKFDGEYQLAADGVSDGSAGFAPAGFTDDGCVVGGSTIWIDDVIVSSSELHPDAGAASVVHASSSGEFHTGVYNPATGLVEYRIIRRDDDADSDGLPDDWELFHGFDPSNPDDGEGDGDGDGLSNLAEFRLGSDPVDPTLVDPETGLAIQLRDGIDTDGDGMPDTWEWHHGLKYSDPGDAMLDYDRDGLLNLEEFLGGTDPWKIDSDGDGLLDFEDPDAVAAGVFVDPAVGFQVLSPLH